MAFVLTTEKLRKLDKHRFERFCRALLDADRTARFERGTVEIAGPNDEDVPDGGLDLQARVGTAAVATAETPLLRHGPGWVLYSCKSHRDDASTRPPSGWIAQVRREIDPAPSIYDARRKAVAADASERADQTPDALRDLIERICRDDAEYCVLINVGASDRSRLADEFARRLRERARLLLGPDVDVRDHQVRVLDANELVNAFNERPFAIPTELEYALGGRDDAFRSWSTWVESIENERRILDYVEDHHRAELHARLESLMDQPSPGSLWIVGDPGVGKTRAVHRFFDKHPELQHRIRQTDDWEDVEYWLRQDRPRSMRDVLLVVDEVPSRRGDELAREFRRSAATTEVKLVMIGTRGEGQGNVSPVFALPRLGRSEFRRLIEAELDNAHSQGPVRARVSMLVERLSQGYPLFAMWLTQGLAKNPELLDEPGTGLTDARDPWTATSLVLASRSAHSTYEQWNAAADIRGRALLLAMLVPRGRWIFSSELEQRFASALGRSWAELDEAARDCRTRGLLRETKRGLLYISPTNLERLVLNHYFGGPHPPLEPGRLRDRLGSRVDRLLVRAQRVGASTSCRTQLADALLDRALEGLNNDVAVPDILLRIAHERPVAVARRVRGMVGSTAGPAPRRMEEISRTIRHLRHRKLDESTFALVEDALFALSPNEDWAVIFTSGFHATYQTFEFRLGLLETRLDSADPDHRRAAIAGLRFAIQPRGRPRVSASSDDIDVATAGPWEIPSPEESAERSACGWALLLRVADDHDREVSAAARHEIAQNFPEGTKLGLRARPTLLHDLAEATQRWTLPERNALGRAMDDVDRHDVDPFPNAPQALDTLRAAIEPHSLEERLIAQVGRWHPLSGSLEAPEFEDQQLQADRTLAAECVASPDTLLGCEQWLDSRDALRVSTFGRALGEVDRDLVLLDPLRERIEAGALHSLTASYLAAWARRDPSAFDRWIERVSPRPRLGEVIATAIAGNDASSFRAEILSDLVERRRVTTTSLRGIGSWGWGRELAIDVLDRLVTALTKTDEPELARPAVGLAGHRIEARPVDPSIADVLVRLVDLTRSTHLPASGEQDWVALVTVLAHEGRTEVLTSIAGAIGDPGYSHQAAQAIEKLSAEGLADELWHALSVALTHDPQFARPLEFMLSQTSLRERLSAETIMEWVGHDPQRGTTVARLTAPHQEVLDPLAHGLIERFGRDSDVARTIEARAGSIPRAVHDPIGFLEQQASHATGWAHDNEGEVGHWACRLAADLRVRAAAEREEDQFIRQFS